MDSGITRISLYPFHGATNAKTMPVLPDVGWMMTLSLFKILFFSSFNHDSDPVLDVV
jgi:hypothetical protein